MEKHVRNAKLNISMTLLSQITTSLCNFILSGVILNTFGSVLYGITNSINQFLSYVSLLEGGVGRVGRAEMYKPLANADSYGVSRVYHALKRFFFFVGIICIAYILFLSLAYYDLAHIDQYSRKYIFALVWILGLITISKYLGGLTNMSLLVADQKQYIANIIIACTAALGMVIALVCVFLRTDLLIVKLVCSLAYIARPVAYGIYVKKQYDLPKVNQDYSKLEQKWSGIGQNIAMFLHTNTDIVLLTLFADIRLVAVYSVYSLVVSNIRLIAITFSSGMEGAMGAVFAVGNQTEFKETFEKYQFVMFLAVFVLFGVTAALILPFVTLYTSKTADVNYIQPMFALLFLLVEVSECIMHPCSSLAVSTNQIKETKWAYYLEVIFNISLSSLLLRWNPLLGLMIGTFVAVLIKNVVFAVYASKKILHKSIFSILKPLVIVYIEIFLSMILGCALLYSGRIQNYLHWFLAAICVALCMVVFAIVVALLFYNKECKIYINNFIMLCRKKSLS